MKFCISCGKQNDDSAVFCKNCGYKFPENIDTDPVKTNPYIKKDETEYVNEEVEEDEIEEEEEDQVEETTPAPKKKWVKWLIIAAAALLMAIIIDSCSKSGDKTLGVDTMVFSNINSSKTLGELVSTGNFCDAEWDSNREDRVWVKFRDKNDGTEYKLMFDVFNDKTQAVITDATADAAYFSELELIGFYKYLGGSYSYQDYVNYLIGLGVWDAILNY